MKVVDHIEMGTFCLLGDAGSGDYGCDPHHFDPNGLQERDVRRAADTNTDIENCIIKQTDNQNIIDDDSRMNVGIRPVFSHVS